MTAVRAELTVNKLPMFAINLTQDAENLLDDAVIVCVAVATPLARHDTGNLRANRNVDRQLGERTLTWLMDYAVYQNMGTVHMEGTHFADRGAEAAQEAIERGLRGMF